MPVVPHRFQAALAPTDDRPGPASGGWLLAVATRFGTLASPLGRLGPGRWRAQLAGRKPAPHREIYLAEQDASCLIVRGRGRFWDIRLDGELAEATALNLGDCLVQALGAGAECIVLRLGRRESTSLAAQAVLESLGRHLARGRLTCRVSIRGTGAGTQALSQALGRGLSETKPLRRP
jgi:hypothetical protein